MLKFDNRNFCNDTAQFLQGHSSLFIKIGRKTGKRAAKPRERLGLVLAYFLRLATGKPIKFQLSLLIISFISTLDPLSMLVSRLFPQIKLLYRSFALASYNNAASGNSIFNRILQTRNFADFMNLHKENLNEFNGELFASTSKHINSLISGRDRIKFTQADELFKHLQAVNVDSLNERHTISILSVLRNIKNRGFIPNGIFKFKEVLVKRYNALIKDREPSENDITDFINAYYEICSFHGNNECRIIATKLLKALETANEKGKTNITDNQIGFLFYAFSLNSELSNTESRIRSLLMRRVSSEIETVKVHDLIKIAVNLNRSDSFDFEPYEFGTIAKITEKIHNSIPDLQERSIYDLIRSENVGKLPGFMKVYEQIHRNIFNEIDDNGETDLTYDSTFRILSYLSDKVSLKDSKPPEQLKFFALFSKYAKQCSQENSKQFPIKVFDLIKNNYLSHEHKEKIVTILSETKPHLNTNLLYEMAVKGYAIGAFTKFIDTYEVGTQRIDVLVKLGIIVNQMIKNGVDLSAKFQQIEDKIAEHFATPQKFIDFYRMIRNERNESISLRTFHEAFSHLFNKLSNPYETEGGSPSYREHYLQYVVDSFRNKELGQFFTKHEAVIKTEDFANLIIYNSKGDAREIEFSRLLIQQLNKRVYEFIECKNKRWVGALIDFLNKHSRYVVSGKLDAGSHNNIMRMLHCLISKLDVLAESEQDFYLFTIVEKFLVKNYHNYNVEASYRNLLRHVIHFLDKINQKKHHLFTTALREGLRLNMINAKSLENVTFDKLYLSFMEKARIEYIKDNKYTPKIDKINQASLQVLFTNHNLEKELAENEKQVVELVNNINSKDIVEYLAIYNVHNTPTARRVLATLLNQLTNKAKGKSFERHNVIGMLQNAQEQSFYGYYQFKNVTELLIEDYKKRIGNYEMENHLELIKFIISQPNLNPTDYYEQIVDYATKRDDITFNQFQQLLLRLVNTNYKFKPSELKEVTNIMKKNHYTGIFFFLMVENDLDPAFRKETVKQFVERFNEKKDGKETFCKLYYQYLKKAYPEETAELNIAEGSLYYQKFSIKPRDTELLNTIIQISGGVSQELPGFGDNYILKIKNFGFNFVYGKKLGSFYEHEFVKRALPIITGENLSFIGVHFYSGNSANTLQYLNKQCPGLFEKIAYESALNAAKSKKQNRGQTEI